MRHRNKDGYLIDPVTGYPAWDLESSTYKAQCKTAAIARQIAGNDSNLSRVDMDKPIPNAYPFLFRLLPAYRTPESLAFRSQVARTVWTNRKAA